jgi:hypothetical protein
MGENIKPLVPPMETPTASIDNDPPIYLSPHKPTQPSFTRFSWDTNHGTVQFNIFLIGPSYDPLALISWFSFIS